MTRVLRAAVTEPRVEIPAVGEVHGGSGHLAMPREGYRIVLDARADHCCVITLPSAVVIRWFDALGEGWG